MAGCNHEGAALQDAASWLFPSSEPEPESEAPKESAGRGLTQRLRRLMAGKVSAARHQQAAAAGAAAPQMLSQATVSKGPEGQAAGPPGNGGPVMLPGLHVHMDGSASSSKSDVAAPHVQPLVQAAAAAGEAACYRQLAGAALHSPVLAGASGVAAGGAASGQQPLDADNSGAASAAVGGAACGQQPMIAPSMGTGSAAEPAASPAVEGRPGTGLNGWGCMAGRPAEAASHPDTNDVIIDMPPDGSAGQQLPQGEARGQGQLPSAVQVSVRGRQSVLPRTQAPVVAATTPQAEPSAPSPELPAHPADAQASGREPLLPAEGDKEPPAGHQDPEVCCCCHRLTWCLQNAASGF